MEWTQSDTIALAKESCTHCHGIGMRGHPEERQFPCGCVLRKIFRVCYGRFRECCAKEKFMSAARLQPCASGKDNRWIWGRKDEEYIADFYLVTQRHLLESEFKVFRYHFLLGADWRLCCQKLQMDRGDFFHLIYSLEEKLGRIYRELRPYGLFPVDEYFEGKIRGPVQPCATPRKRIMPAVCSYFPQRFRTIA